MRKHNRRLGFARIFDWGGGGKPQITCNDAIRNFLKRNFLGGKNIAESKSRNRDLVWLVTRILLKGEDLNQNLLSKNA